MADLSFSIRAEWAGSGREGEGVMETGGEHLRYSAPSSMGGKGVGTSPEELLLAAVTSCYSGTLFRVLERQGLPVERLRIETAGVVEGYPRDPRYGRVTVSPVILGGDPSRTPAYEAAAQQSRDLCFIGKTIRDYLEYVVGDVAVKAER
jgi:osmotically inducible protein OsmC